MCNSFTCVLCPNGCEILVEYENDIIKEVSNALCNKGKEYAISEVRNPQRTLTTSIKVIDGEFPLASVRSEKPIPLSMLKEVIGYIKDIILEAPIVAGQIVAEDINGTGINIVATRKIDRVITKLENI